MTVRTWVTVSVLILVALSVAIVVRLLAPAGAPKILASSGDVRLDGALVAACWPQRGGDLRCQEGSDEPEPATIAPKGELRVVVDYPAQPEEGFIEIARGNERVLREDWDREIAYDLGPGTYTLTVHADYPLDARVRYRFPFRVR